MNKTTGRRRRHKGIAIVLSCGLYFFSAAVLAASSYLQELEVEAARTEQMQKQDTESASAPELPEEAATASEKLAPGLSREQFEKKLQNGYYGSYLFYSTLEEKQQQNVYEDYQENNSLENIRESIKTNLKQ